MICQSCGMPIESGEYCKFCFKDGKFTDEGITMEEKIEKNIKIAVSLGMDKEKAKALAQDTIPKLKRWI